MDFSDSIIHKSCLHSSPTPNTLAFKKKKGRLSPFNINRYRLNFGQKIIISVPHIRLLCLSHSLHICAHFLAPFFHFKPSHPLSQAAAPPPHPPFRYKKNFLKDWSLFILFSFFSDSWKQTEMNTNAKMRRRRCTTKRRKGKKNPKKNQ